MPKYTLPAEKKNKNKRKAGSVAASDDVHWMRRISLPVNKAILESVDAGDMVTVRIDAEIEGVMMSESPDHKECSVKLNLTSVDVKTKTKAVSDAHKDFNEGYKSVNGRNK